MFSGLQQGATLPGAPLVTRLAGAAAGTATSLWGASASGPCSDLPIFFNPASALLNICITPWFKYFFKYLL
jgi:hypothetical protein